MDSIVELIDAFPSAGQLSRDIEVAYEKVKKWRQRDSIPPAYWLPVVQAAHRRGITVSLDDLARIRNRKAA